MSTPAPQVRVGVGLFLLHRGKFLTGIRKGSLGSGKLALPGGHLEFGESFAECSRRELEEETGLRPGGEATFWTATETVFEAEGKHYVTIFMRWEVADEEELGEPELMEPDKCAGWQWTSWSELSLMPSETLFEPLNNLLRTRPGISLS